MTTDEATELRAALVQQLTAEGSVRTRQVEEAFRAMPRHLFLPGIPLETVYKNTHIEVTDAEGSRSTVSSQPSIMALMLEQLELQPGQRVLEIGAGTGYNAALMGHLVGPNGQVVSIDVDAGVVEEARRHVAASGAGNVTLLCADGALGYAPAAPYDRVILTVASRDIAPSWLEQLSPSGRLLLPLEVARAQQHIVCLQWEGDHLSNVCPPVACGFVSLQGRLGTRSVPLGKEPGLALWLEGPEETMGADSVTQLLEEGPQDIIPTGIWIAPGLTHGLRVWLELHETGPGVLTAEHAWADRATIPRVEGPGAGDQREDGQRGERPLG